MTGHKHAYLILAHACPDQVRKLLAMLDDPRNDLFIHIDRKAPFGPQALEGCCRHSAVHFVEPRLRVNWGGVSIMRATLALLKAATSGHYACYHLLSGMDLPIKSQDEIHAFFDANPGREFLQLWPVEPARATRFRYFTLFPEGQGFFLTNWINLLIKGFLIPLHIRINKDVEFHMSAQWFSITDDCARYVLSQEDWLERVFRHTGTCDEVFLPTVLWKSPFRDRIFDATLHRERERTVDPNHPGNLRFIDWTRGESVRHPWIFRESDWDLLMSVPCFWARKFDERVDPVIINRLYERFRPGA
jgi:hypothetical protein